MVLIPSYLAEGGNCLFIQVKCWFLWQMLSSSEISIIWTHFYSKVSVKKVWCVQAKGLDVPSSFHTRCLWSQATTHWHCIKLKCWHFHPIFCGSDQKNLEKFLRVLLIVREHRVKSRDWWCWSAISMGFVFCRSKQVLRWCAQQCAYVNVCSHIYNLWRSLIACVNN